MTDDGCFRGFGLVLRLGRCLYLERGDEARLVISAVSFTYQTRVGYKRYHTKERPLTYGVAVTLTMLLPYREESPGGDNPPSPLPPLARNAKVTNQLSALFGHFQAGESPWHAVSHLSQQHACNYHTDGRTHMSRQLNTDERTRRDCRKGGRKLPPMIHVIVLSSYPQLVR